VALAAAAGCGAGAFPPSGGPPGLRPQSSPWRTVGLADVAGVGRILVDANGFTLYLFVPDRRGAPTCHGFCMLEWPPLVVPAGGADPTPGPGVQGSLLATVPLATGGAQVTYNGWPLYRWVADAEPGQANGEAVSNFGGLWYAVDASGQAVKVRTSL